MKFLMLLILIGLIVYLSGARKDRGQGHPNATGPTASDQPQPGAAQVMVSCAQCGLHVPQSEAFPGRGGHFCSAAHRAIFEARNDKPA